VGYKKYAANSGSISSFVVGGPTSERDLPVAVYKKLSANLKRVSIVVVGKPMSE